MKKILFVCNLGKNRSRTAVEIFKKHYSAKSAGILENALNPLTEDLLEWAEIIFVMEKKQLEFIRKRFPEQFNRKRIICLDIPDIYDFMVKPLALLLKEKVESHLK